MIKTLISLGLIATTFIFTKGDIRVAKLDTAMLFAVAIGLSVFFYGRVKKINNKWLLIFMMYLPVAYMMSPKPDIKLFGMNVGAFWSWQPLFMIFIFFIMMMAVASYQYNASDFSAIFHTMHWCGLLTACYVVLQYFNIDQFFFQTHGGTDGRMAGFVGNPTLVSPFVAMMIPITLYLSKPLQAGVMISAVIMTESQMAIIAMSLSLIVYFGIKGKWWVGAGVIVSILLACALFVGYQQGTINDSSRFEHWPVIAKDIVQPVEQDGPSFPVTGIGVGSFKYTYHIKHNNNYHQAHNEYLEILYGLGLVGVTLFLLAIGTFIKPFLRIGRLSNYCRALFASFICIAVSAFGTFVWQIGTTIFATIVVVGLLINQEASCVS